MSMEAGLPALALIFLLGMRHGLEPDHLAAVDGLTLRSQASHPRWTPWMGGLFALGHGVTVLAIVAVAAVASQQLSPSEAVFGWLEWLPIALLLLIAGLNARSLLAGAQLAEVRGRLLPRSLRGVSGPLGAILVGMLFALVFDTALQAAAWGYAAVALGGMGPALLTGTVFAVGMGVTDTFDGWVTAKVMRTGKIDIVRAFRRRLGWPIVAICVAMAACMAAGKLDAAWSLPESWMAALGGAMVLLMAALYGWTLLGLRRVHA
jgi:high-affinity nickel-transport protein